MMPRDRVGTSRLNGKFPERLADHEIAVQPVERLIQVDRGRGTAADVNAVNGQAEILNDIADEPLLDRKAFVISRDQLLDMVWGYCSGTDERVLDTHMKNLRKALGINGKQIKTVIRRGYKLDESL